MIGALCFSSSKEDVCPLRSAESDQPTAHSELSISGAISIYRPLHLGVEPHTTRAEAL